MVDSEKLGANDKVEFKKWKPADSLEIALYHLGF
jgi:hypothetical protein